MSDLITRIKEKYKLPPLDLDLQAKVSYEVQIQLVTIIQQANKFRRLARRQYLTTQDVTKALKALKIFKFQNGLFAGCHKFEETRLNKAKNIWKLVRSGNQNNRDYNIQTALETQLTFHWLALDGKTPSVAQNIDESKESLDKDFSYKSQKRYDDIQLDSKISEQLLTFYKSFVDFYISQVEREEQERVLDDFKKLESKSEILQKIAMSPGLDPIIGYILDYLFKNQTHHLLTYGIIPQINLDILSAIFSNPFVSLQKYLHKVLLSLMDFMVEGIQQIDDWSQNRTNSLLSLKNRAALRVAAILRRYQLKYPLLKAKISEAYGAILKEGKEPSLVNMYGSLIGILHQGPVVIANTLLPNLNECLRLLNVGFQHASKLSQSKKLFLLEIQNTIQQCILNCGSQPSSEFLKLFVLSQSNDLQPVPEKEEQKIVSKFPTNEEVNLVFSPLDPEKLLCMSNSIVSSSLFSYQPLLHPF